MIVNWYLVLKICGVATTSATTCPAIMMPLPYPSYELCMNDGELNQFSREDQDLSGTKRGITPFCVAQHVYPPAAQGTLQ